MVQYELLLKNGKIRSYDRLSLFILLANFSVFALLFFQPAGRTARWIAAAGAVLLLLLLLVILFLKKSAGNKRDFYVFWAMYIAVVTWIAMGKWWPGLFVLILTVLYQLSKKPLIIFFTAENIKYASFPSRVIKWSELSNAVLKDGIVTIDFKNNKLLQAEVDEESRAVNETEFNDFCRQQLRSNKS